MLTGGTGSTPEKEVPRDPAVKGGDQSTSRGGGQSTSGGETSTHEENYNGRKGILKVTGDCLGGTHYIGKLRMPINMSMRIS